MKQFIRRARVSQTSPVRGREKAFALVAVVALLVLIALVCLGLLSLSTISLRGGQLAEAQARAQANARMSLMIAIGQLQKTLGPDTRVSAAASQSPTPLSQPHWVAAYNTLNPATGMPAVGHMASGTTQEWSTDSRATQTDWRDKHRLGWLVSQPANSTITPQNPGANLVNIAELPSATAGAIEQVQVPRVRVMDATNKHTGNYAYWVTDESTKARLDQIDPRAAGGSPTFALDEKTNSLLMAQRADASKTEGYDWHGKITPQTAARLVTTESMEMAATDPKLASRRSDSFTVHSLGVLSDPVMGGLKLDLGAYLDSTTDGDFNIDLRSQKRGIVGDKVSMVPGKRYSLTGASYGSLRGWRRLGLNLSGATADPAQLSIEPRFPANRSTSRTAGEAYVAEGWIADADNKNRFQVTKASGAMETGVPIHPVIADARISMNFVYDSSSGGNPKILPLFYPRVKIWNPYNVTLSSANYVVVIPFRSENATTFTITGTGSASVSLESMFTSAGLSKTLRYFVFTVQGETFAPGECKVFMPDFSSSGPKLPRSGGSSYAIRYDTADISNNRLTASSSNEPNGAIYLESTQTIPAAVLVGAGAPNIRYGAGDHTFNADGWFLKGALGSLNVPAANVLDPTQGRNFPSLQSIYIGIRGVANYNSGVDEWDRLWDSGSARPELMSQADARLSGNVFAPSQWTRHVRLLYPGERKTNFGDGSKEPPPLALSVANAADWNPRASIHTRFPTSCSSSWYFRWRHPFLCPLEREPSATLAAGTSVSGDSFTASPFWSESASAYSAEHFTFFDVQPAAMPLLSLGRLRHVSLIPFGWQPAYPIGSSRAPFYADATSTVFGEVANRTASDHWKMRADGVADSSFQDIVGNSLLTGDQMLVYDVSFEANAALFDRFFLSGMPRNASGRTQWNGSDSLANSRLKRCEDIYPGRPSDILTTSTDEALKPAAMFLQSGSFNVNSTDVEAWKAVLSHLRETKRKTVAGDAKSKHPYSRIFAPYEAGGPEGGPFSSANFAGMPELDDDEIAALAGSIVDEVKARGPFLSMADFVNHRLAPNKAGAPDPVALSGTLEAAIAATSINGKAETAEVIQTGLQVATTDGYGSGGSLSVDYRRMSPSRTSGMTGCLTQGDLLEPLAPVLTARGDTFVVRSYGEAVDAKGVVIARAWCEAVVQRTPEYLLSRTGSSGTGNEPSDPALIEEWATSANGPYATGKLAENPDLAPVNKSLGRKFRVTQFRWIKPESRSA